jgi:predicted HD phosphohydrolase
VNPPVSIEGLLALMAHGANVYDEPDVDALSHGLQCGALLRAEYPDDVELAIAGLVHDISDIADPDDHRDHDRRGGALVAPLLGTRVARLVGAHVAAKQYLVATDPAYRATLSARSVETLAHQGGAHVAYDFAHDPDIDAMLALRRADERAKDPTARVAPLDTWRPLLEALIG